MSAYITIMLIRRNPVMQPHVSQPSNLSNLPFGGSNQLQFQPQAPPPPLAPRQLRQLPQPAQQQSHLRVQSSSNIPMGLWSNSYKQPSAQSNINSLFNTSMLNKQPLFDTGSTYNQVAKIILFVTLSICLLYTSPSPRDRTRSRMPSSA